MIENYPLHVENRDACGFEIYGYRGGMKESTGERSKKQAVWSIRSTAIIL